MTKESNNDNLIVGQQLLGAVPTENELRELTKALIKRVTRQATVKFKDTVRPIYGVTLTSRPDQLGSSVLVEIDGIRCILTAAHIIDENKSTMLYIGGNDKLIPLIAEFQATKAPEGNRKRDHHDFAVAILPDEMLAGMDRLKFIQSEEIMSGDLGSDRTYLSALGYPNTKNKVPRQGDVNVRAHLFAYSGFNRPSVDLADKLGLSGEDHLFIRHHKYSRDEEGLKSSSVAPRGLSGGAIIHSADFTDREVLLGRAPTVPRLAGITIELHNSHHVLLGTRIHTILNAIRQCK